MLPLLSTIGWIRLTHGNVATERTHQSIFVFVTGAARSINTTSLFIRDMFGENGELHRVTNMTVLPFIHVWSNSTCEGREFSIPKYFIGGITDALESDVYPSFKELLGRHPLYPQDRIHSGQTVKQLYHLYNLNRYVQNYHSNIRNLSTKSIDGTFLPVRDSSAIVIRWRPDFISSEKSGLLEFLQMCIYFIQFVDKGAICVQSTHNVATLKDNCLSVINTKMGSFGKNVCCHQHARGVLWDGLFVLHRSVLDRLCENANGDTPHLYRGTGRAEHRVCMTLTDRRSNGTIVYPHFGRKILTNPVLGLEKIKCTTGLTRTHNTSAPRTDR
jgi:hypothetical protein